MYGRENMQFVLVSKVDNKAHVNLIVLKKIEARW
jgi:hypothetical protein